MLCKSLNVLCDFDTCDIGKCEYLKDKDWKVESFGVVFDFENENKPFLKKLNNDDEE